MDPIVARQLLFGVLAHRQQLVSWEELVEISCEWLGGESETLDEMMVGRELISTEARHRLLEDAETRLRDSGHDASSSLESLDEAVPLVRAIMVRGDERVRAGLGGLVSTLPADGPHSTIAYTDVNAAKSGDDAKLVAGSRYQILRRHAGGGLGEVFLAEDCELGRQVALKEIQARFCDEPASRSRFVREAQITGRLEHPGVVPVYSLGKHPDGRPFYAMRFVHGSSLKSAIDQFHKPRKLPGKPRLDGERNLEFRRLLKRFQDVCDAIQFAHDRHVLHRDLKPANIMLGKYGETLVVDWGLAKDVTSADAPADSGDGSSGAPEETMGGTVLGTPGFMSPEQSAGTPDALAATSDVYSLGCTLYALLAGTAPITGADVPELLKRTRSGDFAAPRRLDPTIPQPLEAICLKAMAVPPGNRYSSAREMSNEIDRYLADEPVEAFPEPWITRLRRWVRRHRVLVSVSVAVIAVAAVSLATASLLLNAARERERTAKDDALRNGREATENFQLARMAVEEMLTEVGSIDLRNIPAAERVRHRLLEKAAAFYEQFVAKQHENPELRGDAARAYLRLGGINQLLGNVEAARAAHDESLVYAENLVAEFPREAAFREILAEAQHEAAWSHYIAREWDSAEPLYRESLANYEQLGDADREWLEGRGTVWNDLGVLLAATGRFDQAKDCYEQALTLRQRLADSSPSPASQLNVAETFNNIGNVHGRQGAVNPALLAHNQALGIREAVAAANPNEKEVQAEVATSYGNVAILQKMSLQVDEARESYRRAQEIYEVLCREHPGRVDYSVAAGRNLMNLGTFLKEQRQQQEALPFFEQAEALFQNVMLQSGTRGQAMRYVGVLHHSWAEALQQLNQHPGAVSHFERALELSSDPLKSIIRMERAYSLAYSDHSVAAAEVAELTSALRDEYGFTLACVLSICSSSVLDDGALSPDERRRLGETYAGRAVAMLEALAATDFFRSPETVQEMTDDPDLAPLKDREDFRGLLERLRKE